MKNNSKKSFKNAARIKYTFSFKEKSTEYSLKIYVMGLWLFLSIDNSSFLEEILLVNIKSGIK